MISTKLRVVVVDQMAGPDGRFPLLIFHIEGDPYTLSTLYTPNSRLLLFLDKCLAALSDFSIRPLIVCRGDMNYLGDMNVGCSGNRKWAATSRHRGEALRGISQLLAQHQLLDLWRYQHPTERDYTYFSQWHNTHSRIDYLFLPLWLTTLKSLI